KTFTQSEQSIAAYGALTDESGRRFFDLTVVRVAKPTLVIARAPQVRSREDAERLKGVKLFAPRDRLPPTEEDEFYVEDLIGLAAKTDSGRDLGRITAVHNFGAGDIIEIRRDGAPALLTPFTISAIPHVSIALGAVTVAEAALEEWEVGSAPPEGEEQEDQS
ncbi:MAG: ribosome maturation factor RimM, partial [Parvularculaceae bacterium]|nr:ribosome maturation factor RimM [Parvularculaceae bacterium]